MTTQYASIIVGNIVIVPDECYSIAEYQEAKATAIEALKFKKSITDVFNEHLSNETTELLLSNIPIQLGSWIDRMLWHIQKCNDYHKKEQIYQLKVQKCIQGLEETKSTTYDMMSSCRNNALDRAIEIIKEEMGVQE